MPCDSKMTTWTLGYSTNNLMDYIELTKVTDRPNGATHSTARATHSTGHRSLSEGLSAAILPRTKCSRRSSRPYSTHIRDLTAPASPSLRNSNSVCCHPSKCQAGCRVDADERDDLASPAALDHQKGRFNATLLDGSACCHGHSRPCEWHAARRLFPRL